MNIKQPAIILTIGANSLAKEFGGPGLEKQERMQVQMLPGETVSMENGMFVHYPNQEIEFVRTDKTTAIEFTDEEKELLRDALGVAINIMSLVQCGKEFEKSTDFGFTKKTIALIDLENKINPKDE